MFKTHPARHPGEQEKIGPPKEKLVGRHEGMDKSNVCDA